MVRQQFHVEGPPRVGFALAQSGGRESSGRAVLDVVLSQPVSQTVSVNYAVTGGTAGECLSVKALSSPRAIGVIGAPRLCVDYILDNGTLTFAPNQTRQQIAITLLDDGKPGPDKTIEVTLSGASNALLGTAMHTFTILDDDGTPVIQLPYLPGPVGVVENLPIRVSPPAGTLEQANVTPPWTRRGRPGHRGRAHRPGGHGRPRHWPGSGHRR
jgi:hypothetical protein